MKKPTKDELQKKVADLDGKLTLAQIALMQCVDAFDLAIEVTLVPSTPMLKMMQLARVRIGETRAGTQKTLHQISTTYTLACASKDECGPVVKAAGYKATKKKGSRRG